MRHPCSFSFPRTPMAIRALGLSHKKEPFTYVKGPSRKAATCSPTWCGSTIGADGLNFPVRNGKGWAPSPWPPKIFPSCSPKGGGTGYILFRFRFSLPLWGSRTGNDIIMGQARRKGHSIFWANSLFWYKKGFFRPPFPKEKGALRKLDGQLVPLGYMYRYTSTYGLSTW